MARSSWRRRDRNGTFDPKIVAKGQTRFTGFDDKIVSMYARGMTTREIQGHLQEIYGVDVSPTLISNVTEAIVDEVRAWQNRSLDEFYPIVYMDALRVKIRADHQVEARVRRPSTAHRRSARVSASGPPGARPEPAFWSAGE